jgi:5-methyltetrahydrofolate--homocysteine methyltransferase
MKQAVNYLQPYIEAEKEDGARAKGKVVMATVKGDVHDIGKNIVGVVLQCNNFEVIDLGVMVPWADILQAARHHGADMIGLSGLITPSLDEMVTVAGEMERQDLKIPLLIGGATTSKVHTAVKIAPQYSGPTTYVLDASRAVGVASTLVSEGLRDKFVADTRAEYQDILEKRLAKPKVNRLVSLEAARANKAKVSFGDYKPAKPAFIGTKVFEDYPLAEIAECIDWTPFFRTWELAGTYPAILEDEVVGESAKSLFADAKEMLKQIIEEKWLTAKGVVGFWPAYAEGDDIRLFEDESRTSELSTIHCLRQQVEKRAGRANDCLADFVATKEGPDDWFGGFAVTTGHGIEKHVQRFKDAHDDYNEIMVKALADRLAEAFAERMHQRVRTEFWGYAKGENLTNEELIKERYQGIRPAPGYPACPDHSEKPELFRLLNAGQMAGIELTDSFAMVPTAAVSGYYFAHPDAHYFGVGKIGPDQLEEYAARRNVDIDQAEKWLRPNLAD